MHTTNETINRLMKDAIVADMVLGFEPEIEVPHKWQIPERYHQSGFNYLGLAIAGEFTNLETAIRYIGRHRAAIRQSSEKYQFVETANDIFLAKEQNKLALGFWLQGANPLANDPHMIEVYYRLGIRSILLSYNTRNGLGDGLAEKNDAGLSQLGRSMIAEMNQVGMLIDLSHAGIRTSLEAIEASKDPVIFSHSNARQIAPHIRNLNDEQIIAVAEKKGLIGINGASLLLGTETSAATALADHIEYIAQLVGTESIALGLDMIYFHEILSLFYQNAGEHVYPKGYTGGKIDSFSPEKIIELIEILFLRKFSESDIKKILGGNFMRVINHVWK